MTAFIAALGGASARGATTGQNQTAPYINPDKECLTEAMINPPGKDYRYLYSKDCRVVYVLPPAVEGQEIHGQAVNIQACQGYNASVASITALENTINAAEEIRLKYENEIQETTSPSKVKILKEKLDSLNGRLSQYRVEREQAVKANEQIYGQMPGAVFSILLDSSISQSELNDIRALNAANLNRIIEVQEKDRDAQGNEITRTTYKTEISSLRPVPVSSSIYSFDYISPKNGNFQGGLISTSIPGLEALEQVGAKTTTIHVRGGDVVTGKVIMSLPTVCPYAQKNEQGQFQVDPGQLDPFFTVNRTLEVQEHFTRGFTASLKLDQVVEQITNFVSTQTDQGFQKSQLFEPIISTDSTKLIQFQWDEGYQEGPNTPLEKVIGIYNEVTADFINSYFNDLVKAGIVSVEEPPKQEPTHGGYVDENRTGRRCWNNSRSVFGVRISGGSGCADYVYTVKVWKDGITQEELRKRLTISGDYSKSVHANEATPFYFTTAFMSTHKE
jgi:hypothetical protein